MELQEVERPKISLHLSLNTTQLEHLLIKALFGVRAKSSRIGELGRKEKLLLLLRLLPIFL